MTKVVIQLGNQSQAFYVLPGGKFAMAGDLIPFAKSIELRQSITLSAPMTLTGIRPDGPLEVVACLPDQTVRRLLWIRNFRPEWNRVYYFREPLGLPKGTRILLYSAHGATLFVA